MPLLESSSLLSVSLTTASTGCSNVAVAESFDQFDLERIGVLELIDQEQPQLLRPAPPERSTW